MVENEYKPAYSTFQLWMLDSTHNLIYGVPLKTIPYKVIVTLPDDDDVDTLHAAYDLVEKEKVLGKPGAFITERYEEQLNGWVYEVWSWQD